MPSAPRRGAAGPRAPAAAAGPPPPSPSAIRHTDSSSQFPATYSTRNEHRIGYHKYFTDAARSESYVLCMLSSDNGPTLEFATLAGWPRARRNICTQAVHLHLRLVLGDGEGDRLFAWRHTAHGRELLHNSRVFSWSVHSGVASIKPWCNADLSMSKRPSCDMTWKQGVSASFMEHWYCNLCPSFDEASSRSAYSS